MSTPDETIDDTLARWARRTRAGTPTVGSVEPLESWRAVAAADAIRGALDAIRRVRP